MRERGFTLVEVVVALAVLGFLLTLLTGVQRNTLQLESRAREARLLGQRVASELRLQRTLPASVCHDAGSLPAGWSCRLTRGCLGAPPGCAVEVVGVEVASSEGHALGAVTATSAALRGLQVVPP